jgi:hypothetical protein
MHVAAADDTETFDEHPAAVWELSPSVTEK